MAGAAPLRTAERRSLVGIPGRRAWCLAAAFAVVSAGGTVHAEHSPQAVPARDTQLQAGNNVRDGDSQRRAGVQVLLRHIYSVYFGVRACTELGVSQNDRSYAPEVTLAEAREVLRRIDAAAAEVGVDSGEAWDAATPLAVVTAEALKAAPATHLEQCQRVGSLFRTDAGQLQANLRALGAKTPLITKDY